LRVQLPRDSGSRPNCSNIESSTATHGRPGGGEHYRADDGGKRRRADRD
jgi:hypothetical protein